MFIILSKYETMEPFSIISINVSVPHLPIYRIQLQASTIKKLSTL